MQARAHIELGVGGWLGGRVPPRLSSSFSTAEISTADGGAMSTTNIIGILLIVLGVLALAYQGITYTTREKVIDLGPIKATKDTEKTIPLPPILGGAALAGGVVLLIAGARSK
jgi:hypothetical protein